MTDRQPSVLTNTQRDYLKEGGEGAAARMTRKRIKERVREGLYDFQLLVSRLDKNARTEAFEDPGGEHEDTPLDTFPAIFAFLYLGLTDVEPSDLAKDDFEQMVASGVRRAIVQRGISPRTVEVDITIETGPTLEELKEKDRLSLFEIMQLVEGGEISGEKGREWLDRLLQERGGETVDEDFQGAARNIPFSVVDALFEDDEK